MGHNGPKGRAVTLDSYAMNTEPTIRKQHVPRLDPGTRVAFTPGKWWGKGMGMGYELQPREHWGKPILGYVIDPKFHKGWHFGPDHAWGVSDWESVVDLDEPQGRDRIQRVTKYPTSMLDVIDTPTPQPREVQAAFNF